MEGVPSTSRHVARKHDDSQVPSASKYIERNREERVVPSSSKDVDGKREKRDASSSSKYDGRNREDRKTFSCSFCTLNEKYDYRGMQPPFQKHLTYLEECYIMRDPFSPLNQREALVLGGDCYFCKKPACMECSVFYTKRFCKTCALTNIQDFPAQLHKKIKQLSNDSENTSTQH